MKGPFQYSGNKLFLVDTVAKLINENMPNYKVYVEPFLGSGSIFYNVPFKDDAKYIINDLDEYVYRMHNSFKSGYSYNQYLKLSLHDIKNNVLISGLIANEFTPYVSGCILTKNNI